MMVGASSQAAQRPCVAMRLSSPTPLGAWWIGAPPDAGALTDVGPTSVAMTDLLSRASGLDGLLHVGQGRVDGLLALDGGIRILLDGLGDCRVERGDRARFGVLDGGLQNRQVRQLGDEFLIVVELAEHRRERTLRGKELLVLFRGEELQEVKGRGLVLRVDTDRRAVATEGRGTRTVLARE